MQHPFSCLPATYDGIEQTLSPGRVGRYMLAANGDKQLALRLYVWNAELCQSLYLPIQIAEIAARNAIHNVLQKRYPPDWSQSSSFISTLSEKLSKELSDARRKEQEQHGLHLKIDHIVSALSFGFWISLTTRYYYHILWKPSIRLGFPYAPRGITLDDINTSLSKLRTFRNRIAHHNAIFDKGPISQFQNVQKILSWICPETQWFVTHLASVSRVINDRPT